MVKRNTMYGQTQYNVWSNAIQCMVKRNTMYGQTQYNVWSNAIQCMVKHNTMYGQLSALKQKAPAIVTTQYTHL